MHLEEKDSAISLAGPRVFHFHACENDRGVPVAGQVHWAGVVAALKAIDYQGAVVIESFTPQLEELPGQFAFGAILPLIKTRSPGTVCTSCGGCWSNRKSTKKGATGGIPPQSHLFLWKLLTKNFLSQF